MVVKIKNIIICMLILLAKTKPGVVSMRKIFGTVAGVFILSGMAAHSWAGNLESALRDDDLLVIPQVKIGEKTYYVRMKLVNAENFTFTVDPKSVMETTRPEAAGGDVNINKADIIGKWTNEEDGVENFYIIFKESGNYEIFENFDDEGCIPGTEYGIYDWEISTGMLRSATNESSDGNGECGIGNVAPFLDKPLRIFVEGDTMQILDPGQDFDPSGFIFIRVAEL